MHLFYDKTTGFYKQIGGSTIMYWALGSYDDVTVCVYVSNEPLIVGSRCSVCHRIR